MTSTYASSSTLSTLSAEDETTESRASQRRSAVWDYFQYDVAQQKSVCQVEQTGSGSLCGKNIAGKNPTNLKKHLSSFHHNVFLELSKKEDSAKKLRSELEAKKKETSLKHYYQSSLKESFNKRVAYCKDDPQYKAVTRKLAIFIGSSNVANYLTESLGFKDLLTTLDSWYPVPARTGLNKELDSVYHFQPPNVPQTIQTKKGKTFSPEP